VDGGQPSSKLVGVKRIVNYPDFLLTPDVLQGQDLALLLLMEDVTFTDQIKPICLPDSQDVYTTRSLCYISGWGANGLDPEQYPTILQDAKEKIVPTTACNDSSAWNGVLDDGMLCAG